MSQPGIEPRSPEPLADTLTILKPIISVQTIDRNTWNHLSVYKQMSSDLFKNNVIYKLFTYKWYIYIYQQDLYYATSCAKN